MRNFWSSAEALRQLLLHIMLAKLMLQCQGHDLPPGHGQLPGREVLCMHARPPPLPELLFKAPKIKRSIAAPAVEHSVGAACVCSDGVHVNTQSVHAGNSNDDLNPRAPPKTDRLVVVGKLSFLSLCNSTQVSFVSIIAVSIRNFLDDFERHQSSSDFFESDAGISTPPGLSLDPRQ